MIDVPAIYKMPARIEATQQRHGTRMNELATALDEHGAKLDEHGDKVDAILLLRRDR